MDALSESELNEAVVSACRTGLGDELRSVVYFTPEAFDLLYLRGDLYDDETKARAVKAALVETERRSVWPDDPYTERLDGADAAAAPAGFGEYEFTVRVFAGGFVGRVVTPEHGLIVTVDELDARALEDVAVTLRSLLVGNPPAPADRNR
jgi:hypothetical protein